MKPQSFSAVKKKLHSVVKQVVFYNANQKSSDYDNDQLGGKRAARRGWNWVPSGGFCLIRQYDNPLTSQASICVRDRKALVCVEKPKKFPQ